VLDDLTCRLPPDGWARQVAGAYALWGADRIVAEANNGGQMVETVLRTVDPSLPITLVHASQGKLIHAEPVAAVYEQHKVHHVGAFPQLEDQMCTWIKGQAASPDRVDALVWALTDLKPGRVSLAGPVFSRKQSHYAWSRLAACRASAAERRSPSSRWAAALTPGPRGRTPRFEPSPQ